MNFIVCDQRCRHQEEGYCTLNQIARLSNDISAKCGYFEAAEAKRQREGVPTYQGLPQDIQSL